MVTYRDVAKRHAVYGASILSVVLFAEYTWFLVLVLSGLLGGVRWHMGTPPMFSVMACTCVPLATSMCVKLSVHTLWFAYGIPILSIPPWLLAVHGLSAHWALDAYFLVTLRDVRKTTLP